MKQMKYLFAGALMLGLSVPVMAQEDTKTIVESITKVIKSKSKAVRWSMPKRWISCRTRPNISVMQ